MRQLEHLLDKYSWVSAPIVRYAIALVYLYFGISQLIHPESFTFFIPQTLSALVDPVLLIYFNAGFEILFASLLILGKYTRISAFLLFVHLFFITLSLGFTQNGVRDFGLTMATLAVAIHGPDAWCLEYRKK